GAVQVPVSYHPIFVTLPAPAALCSDRPRVSITIAKGAAGSLVATLRSNTSTTLLANQIQSVQVLAATNASIDLGTRTNVSGNFTEPFAAGTTAATLTFRRANGVGSAQVPLIVTDNC